MDTGFNNHKPQSYHSCNYTQPDLSIIYLILITLLKRMHANLKIITGKIEKRDYKKYKSLKCLIMLKRLICDRNQVASKNLFY